MTILFDRIGDSAGVAARAGGLKRPVAGPRALLARWKSRLLASATAKLIAIEMIERHGDRATAAVLDALRDLPDPSDDGAVLRSALREIALMQGVCDRGRG